MLEVGGQKNEAAIEIGLAAAVYGHEFRDETRLLAKEML